MRKRFNTTFSTEGWFGLYVIGMVLNVLLTMVSVPLSFMTMNRTMLTVLNPALSFVRIFIFAFFITAAYTKAILLLINTLSLDGKRFATKLEYKSFFLFVLANIIVSTFTIGIYIPWAYKAIIDRLSQSIEYEGDGRFSFLSKASQLFLVVFTSIIVVAIISVIFVLSISIASGSFYNFNIIIVPISVVLFFGILAAIAFMKVFTINWYCNIGFASQKKNVTYSLNINITSAIIFYLGQTIILILTLGFYAGVYILSIYEYFASRIVEKKGNEQTGCILFVKPSDKGAGFLLMQAIFSLLTAGIYTPFAYVEYAKFFINNTYLDTKEEEPEETKDVSLPDPAV